MTNRVMTVHHNGAMNTPADVTRSQHLRSNVTLNNCSALMFRLASGSCVVAWKGHSGILRSDDGKQHLRSVRPGDYVKVRGERVRVEGVEIYR